MGGRATAEWRRAGFAHGEGAAAVVPLGLGVAEPLEAQNASWRALRSPAGDENAGRERAPLRVSHGTGWASWSVAERVSARLCVGREREGVDLRPSCLHPAACGDLLRGAVRCGGVLVGGVTSGTAGEGRVGSPHSRVYIVDASLTASAS